MIRWRFVIKRVLIVLAILALVRWSLGPLAQFASVWTLENTVGAKVEIAQTQLGFFPPRLQFVDLQVGNPREGKQHENAFSATTVDLALDGNALLHRRFVVNDGRISGVQIGGERSTSGHLEPSPEDDAVSTGPSVMDQLLRGLSQSTVEGLETAAGGLETVKRSDEIRRRWKAEYADLARRAKALETEIRQIRDEGRGIDNPLRDLPRLQATIQRAEAVRKELLAIRQKMDSLPAQIQVDWIAMEEAKQLDLQRIRQLAPTSSDQPETFGPELLKDIVRTQIQGAREYLDSAREIADWTVASPKASERTRGDDIRLVHDQPLPGVLIRRCQFDGAMSVNRDAYTVTGILENLTPQTERLAQPMRARLRLEGPRTVRVDFMRHYNSAGTKPRDVLTAHWPNLQIPAARFGKPDTAQLSIDGGNLELYVMVEAVGDQMRGQLISRQSDTQLHLETAPKYSQLAAVQSLQNSVAAIDHIEVQAQFAGTWQDLNTSLATNLTAELSRGLKDAMHDQIAASQQQLAQKIHFEHHQQMLKLQAWLGEQHSAARDVMAKADAEIDSLKNKLVSELPSASTYLGKLGAGKVGSALRELR